MITSKYDYDGYLNVGLRKPVVFRVVNRLNGFKYTKGYLTDSFPHKKKNS